MFLSIKLLKSYEASVCILIIQARAEDNNVDDSVESKSEELLQTDGAYDFNRGTPTDPDILEKRNTIKEVKFYTKLFVRVLFRFQLKD